MSNSTTTDLSATMRQQLDALGADPALLDAEQRRRLDVDGFCVFTGLIEPAWLAELRDTVDRLYEAEGRTAGREHHQEAGAPRLADLVNKDAVFDRVWSHPVVLTAVAWQLGRDFQLSSLNARDAAPGEGRQGLHADWKADFDGTFHVCNSIWLLDDFTADNGATRLVPGSQRRSLDRRYLDDADRDHPDQVVLEAPAGSVCVFSSHCWHGGTRNTSGARRRAMHSYYVAREHPQQLDQQQQLRYATWKRLSPAQKFLLGVVD